ncbi:hypothetical protein GALL_60860 [mine drainage metagenome]|uniref:Elongation factor P maturation arginine rhamnosyltransferase EarP n=1 Tax=mine drainage metagenome TaxID=410659 RepID=A0A1J5SWQ2_9ZZZZ
MNNTNKHWDIFCKIVDNFGDIGVCWRLSQQLAREHLLQVRLFIDDFNVARKIIIDLDLTQISQVINNVEICAWPAPMSTSDIKPAHVVIETFACGLPDFYLQQMQPSKTIWINLEYLSAEAWVSDFHAKSSPHPTLPVTKYYFFPGFFDATGGLIREKNLMTTRNEFLNSKVLQKEFWRNLSIEKKEHPQTSLNNTALTTEEPIKISLFCYPQANIKNLFLALENAEKTIDIFMPVNESSPRLYDVFTHFKSSENGKIWHKGNLTVYVIPFLSQTDYDRLLWACDLNFVRGEDSWIRAIWAGKPFIWQPYIQEDDAHIHKLKAFLEAYLHDATQEMESTLHDAHLTWSQSEYKLPQIWSHIINHLPSIQVYTSQQTVALANQADLATKLVIFSKNLRKNRV